jgi:hypothetical protein
MVFRIPRRPEDDAAGPALSLDTAIDEFYGDFPEHRDNVFILNHQRVTDCIDVIKRLKPDIARLKEQHKDLAYGAMIESVIAGAFEAKMPCSVNIGQSLFNKQDEQVIYARVVVPAGDEFHARALKSLLGASSFNDMSDFPAMPQGLHNTAMWQRYVLDHELGHAVTMLSVNKQDAKHEDVTNRRECEADAYAMIRHFQRYGADSTFPVFIRDLRNMNALHLGDVGHWTSRAIDRVIDMNAKGLLAGMTPAAARDAAIDIARDVALSADASFHVSKAAEVIKAVKRGPAHAPGDRVLDLIFHVAQAGAETRSPAVLEICRRYIDTVAAYVNRDMPQHVQQEKLERAAQNVSRMRGKSLTEEPPIPEVSRRLRNAFIDAMSGRRPDGQKPKDAKPPRFGT